MSAALDFRRVRYLYEAVSQGSVRAAADAMDMNPSVVSRQIGKLEQEFAVALLERHGRGVKPTEAGQLLVDYFRQQASCQDDLVTKVQELRGLARGHIDMVLGEGFVSDLMAESKRRLALKEGDVTKFPRGNINTHDQSSYEGKTAKYIQKIYGDTELGGTQMLKLAAVPFDKLGMPTLPERSFASVSETMQHTLYGGLIAPLAFLGVLGYVAKRNVKDEEEDGHEHK